ncbi:MAG: hypothetical protein ACRC4V_07930 [Aeromonas veronii]
MSVISLSERRQRHQEYLDLNRAAGNALLSYQTPCCGHRSTTVAAADDDVYDSAAVCLGCGSLYWRVITNEQVEVKP